MKTHSRIADWVGIVAVAAAVMTAVPAAQKAPADAAARLTGTWTINRELSPGFRAPGGRPGGPGRPSTGLTAGGSAARFNAAPAYGQRGGGRGGDGPASASDLTPAELAAQAAMRQLQQLADEIKIDATADRVTFTDVRGERSYTTDGKSAKVMVNATEVSTKSKWDKTALKQEFSTAAAKLTQTWDVDADGRLVLTAKVESLRLRTPDQKAVFDKKK